jgi:hypothetical protein
MWALSNWCMIGRWILHLPFSMLYIQLGVSEMKINVVGFLPKDNLLRLELFTNFSSPTLTILSLGRASGGPRLL